MNYLRKNVLYGLDYLQKNVLKLRNVLLFNKL